MKYITARMAWHDAYSDGFSPDLVEALMNLPKGTGHDKDSKIWHQVLAGKIQSAACSLKKKNPHLYDFGMLCFAPDNMRTREQYNRVEDELWRQFMQTHTYDGTQSTRQMILCRMAVEQQIHREQSGRRRFSQADCYGRLAMSKNEWDRRGHQRAWLVLNELIADWTGKTLGPVTRVIREFREKHEALTS